MYTQYKFKTIRAPETATVYRITWPWDQFEEVLKAWQRWAPSVDTRLGSELSIGPKKGGNVSMVGLFLGSKTEAVRMREFLEKSGGEYSGRILFPQLGRSR